MIIMRCLTIKVQWENILQKPKVLYGIIQIENTNLEFTIQYRSEYNLILNSDSFLLKVCVNKLNFFKAYTSTYLI